MENIKIYEALKKDNLPEKWKDVEIKTFYDLWRAVLKKDSLPEKWKDVEIKTFYDLWIGVEVQDFYDFLDEEKVHLENMYDKITKFE